MEQEIIKNLETNVSTSWKFAVKKFYRSIFSIADAAKERGLVIYGAGHWGCVSLEIFKLFDVTPVCFCDDDENKIGKEVKGITVLSLCEAVEKYGDAVFIVGSATVDISRSRRLMQEKLIEHGVLSEFSGFNPARYIFLLNGALELCRPSNIPEKIEFRDPSGIIVFNHGGNSGSIYLETLMDGNPNILTMPLSVSVTTARDGYLNRIRFLEGEELIIEIAAQISLYSSESPLFNAVNAYRNAEGKTNENVFIVLNKAVSFISSYLKGKKTISFAEYIKILYLSYNYAAGNKIAKEGPLYIFFHLHEPDFDFSCYSDLITEKDFSHIEYWFIFREPVNHINSQIRRLSNMDIRAQLAILKSTNMLERRFSSQTGYFQRETEYSTSKTVKIIRFEDVKKNTEGFMRAVCKWLDIEFDDIMLTTTVNGCETYFPKRGGGLMTANDMSALSKDDYDKYLTSFDIFRLNLVFQDFMKAYEYECDAPDYKLFSDECLKELFSIPFKFEESLNEASNRALQAGIIDELPDFHSIIVELWLDFMKEGHFKLVGDLIKPLADEEY